MSSQTLSVEVLHAAAQPSEPNPQQLVKSSAKRVNQATHIDLRITRDEVTFTRHEKLGYGTAFTTKGLSVYFSHSAVRHTGPYPKSWVTRSFTELLDFRIGRLTCSL